MGLRSGVESRRERPMFVWHTSDDAVDRQFEDSDQVMVS
jgi:hypothetical protein